MNIPTWVKEATRLYVEENYSYKKIGEIFNINRKIVSYYLRLNGVKSNPKYTRKINPEKLRKYNYKTCESIFNKIDTEEKAYWLGFLYADGYVSETKNTIELSLKEEDVSHLEKFRSFLGLEEKRLSKKTKEVNNQIKTGYRFSFDCEKTKKDLINLGCYENKTFILKFPTEKQVPTKLIHHFIRGYIDGDGCIYVNKNRINLEILGTEDFLKGVKDYFSIGNSKIYDFKHSNIKRIIYGNRQALTVLEKIYKNATVFLERKYNKYNLFAVQ